MANSAPRLHDSGSNYAFYDKELWASVPHSKFDYSYINSMTVETGFSLIPVMLMEVLPTDSIDLSIEAIIRVNPTVVPLMSRMRVIFHSYFMAMSDLWKDAETFISKGHTRAASPRRPCIGDAVTIGGNSVTNLGDKHHAIALTDEVSPGSLADYLGIPLGLTYKQLNDLGVSALPFMMYEAIKRYEYTTANFFNDDRGLYPDDPADFRLNSAGAIISSYNEEQAILDRNCGLGVLRYRNWADDYFTSARATPIFGDTPAISPTTPSEDDSIEPLSLRILKDGQYVSVPLPTPTSLRGGSSLSSLGYYSDSFGPVESAATRYAVTGVTDVTSRELNYHGFDNSDFVSSPDSRLGVDLSSVYSHISITLDMLRELNAAQIELEKMARTDGSYKEFMEALYGKSPSRSRRYNPVYIGGTYQPIVLEDVLQTSSTDETSPQGNDVGHMYSASSGRLGHFTSDDFGYIMTVMSIVPDTYYSQGLHRMWLRQTQEDLMFPTRTRLGMQGIMNCEVFATGDVTADTGVWAYQDRGDEYRYHANEVHGRIADWSQASYHPYIQQKHFASLPAFNDAFVSGDPAYGFRMDESFLLSKPESGNDPAFVCQIANRITAVRGIPYKAIPEGLF